MGKNENYGDVQVTHSISEEVSSATSSPVDTIESLEQIPVESPDSVQEIKIPVWSKKDLQGKPQMMSLAKAMEKITNKGEIVVDPVTGENIHLLRIFRGRRTFYGKGRITATNGSQFQETPESLES